MHYGYIPDQRDQRDLTYTPDLMALPNEVDLRPQCPPVYDQGALGSCTSNAIAAAIEFDRKLQGLPDFVPSRLFIYYNERKMEGTIQSDAGASIRDGIKSVNKVGACPEDEWPYNIPMFTQEPTAQCYTDAKLHLALQYSRVSRQLGHMRQCLASGFGFVFGFTVYESFESSEVAQTGIVPMPSLDESVLGGHAVVAVGYDNIAHQFIVRNSWGTGWGMGGYCLMPYAYLLNNNLSSDFWTIRVVE